LQHVPPLEHPPTGRSLWRSLEDRAADPAFRELVGREFPSYADEMLAPSRRDFLRLMGASVALAGMTSCRRWPSENIVPFAHLPEGCVPGSTERYATSFELQGAAVGLLVTSYDGRPIKIEGNPSHPQSLGATDPIAQATVLQLYDPDRSDGIVERSGGAAHARRDKKAFAAWAGPHFAELKASGGQGLRVLAEPSSSPTLRDQKARFAAAFPKAAWVEWDPLSRDAAREGAVMAFGRPLRVHLDLAKADVIAAFDADILFDDPAALANARAWARRRRAGDGTMNRLYAIEAAYSLTGGSADHRIVVTSSLVPVVLGRLAAKLLEAGMPLPRGAEAARAAIDLFAAHPFDDPRIARVASDLMAAAGKGAIVVGPRQPAAAHALAHVLNTALGNTGAAVWYSDDPDGPRAPHREAIADLAAQMGAGRVDTLVVLGGNPVFDVPADLDFAGKLAKVRATVRLGLYDDETSAVCRWHVPQAHYLESWGDARGWDGTAGVVQPLIEPLYDGMSAIELCALLVDGRPTAGYELVRSSWGTMLPAGEFETAWRRVVHDGVLADSRYAAVTPAVGSGWGDAARALASVPRPDGGSMELVFARGSGVHDGRYANLGWLVELPDPITKLTWDNAALLNPQDAQDLGVTGSGDLLTITANGKKVTVPAFVVPGQAKGSVSVALGWGRTMAGRVGTGIGVDVNALRSHETPWLCPAKVERASGRAALATTQDHHIVDTLGKREQAVRADVLIRTGTLSEYKERPDFAREMIELPHDAPLWKEHEYNGHKWGMAIDLSACTGCHACTIACQAENNIPVVGKSEVRRGREMHWIRVDRYFEGDPEAPSLAFQPMACHHCENAPCEQVCPVAATVHDHEGLNVMVYNRCVGTRYCSNNCPYKVRRFNWFNNHKSESAVAVMVYNPEVTVRARGVMEKCTYCIQRIEAVKILAKNGRREIADGEIVPACAQVCPTEAIVFGDLNDVKARVRHLHADPRCYGVLEEVNTKPRTRYLARLRNPSEGWV
jgi:molybdopterin-containing oxidoreductase family iron-sulfur binding subunit